MRRHLTAFAVTLLVAAGAVTGYVLSSSWEGWARIADILTRGDNLPIAALVPLLAFFTYVALSQARRHDRLVREGRSDEILDEMMR